jgi:hypothetical protein
MKAKRIFSVHELELFMARLGELLDSEQLQILTEDDETDNKTRSVEMIIGTRMTDGRSAILMRLLGFEDER